MAPDISSPSVSTSRLPFSSSRPRRGSLVSIRSRAGVDKEVLAQALDDIHTEASRSGTLTCFHDFDGEGSGKGPKELVTNSVSGLYSRFKQAVGSGYSPAPSKDSSARPKSSGSRDSLDSTSLQPASPNLSRSSEGIRLSTTRASAESSPLRLTSPTSSAVLVGNGDADAPVPLSGASRLYSTDGRPVLSTLSIDTAVSGEANARSTKVNHDAPFRKDFDRPGISWIDDDQMETAKNAFAPVQSRSEVSISEPPKQLYGALLEEDLEDAVDVSDAGEGRADRNSVVKSRSNSRPDVQQQQQATKGQSAQRPPAITFGPSHLPGFDPSRASSTTDGAETVSATSSQTNVTRPGLEPSPNINSGFQRKRTIPKHPLMGSQGITVAPHYKRRVLSKDFWMKDDNAKVCFSCGQSFSTFRRKHHCRTCGQIFDAKCTNLVNGRPFGQPGTVRLCRPCEEIIFDNDDDSTVFSDDDEYMKSPVAPSYGEEEVFIEHFEGLSFRRTDNEVTTPSIGIPVSRRNREAKRRSAVLEFDTHPTLARPSSAHSLVSLSRRPRSSSHRRRQSRHQSNRGFRPSIDNERGPFHQEAGYEPEKKHSLPTFHRDNIIDPDLAAFLSDEDSDEDYQPNIMSMVGGNGASPGDRDKLGFGSHLASAYKKGRSKTSDRGPRPSSAKGGRDDDLPRHSPRLTRHRNISSASLTPGRPSPRRSRSTLLNGTVEVDHSAEKHHPPLVESNQSRAKVVCSSVLRSLHTSTRDDVELYPASYGHVQKILAQILRARSIPNPGAWEKALMPVLLQCTNDVEPDVQQGDDMDIRHYVKLKKIAGAKPGDTSYVSGVVFSKNVALKTMPRSISNPRIAIVTFAIEYARHEAHFMSLEPVIAQEHEYLENLVNRIAALQPKLLLVQKHVSGLALKLLEKAGITVAYNIKDSVLAAVARVTQARIISSVDKLGIDPSHLGQCDRFDVKAYVSDGIRKSYIYLSGCEPDLGCTIVLRGANTKTLREIKRITEFMCYVAYNLKLENYLMRDEFASIPVSSESSTEPRDQPSNNSIPITPSLEEMHKSVKEKLGNEDGDEEIHFKYEALERETRKMILSSSPFVVFMQPYLLTQLRDLEQRLATYKMLRDRYAAADEDGEDGEDEFAMREDFRLVQPEMVLAPPSKEQPKAVREYLHAVHEAQFEKAKYTYEVQERQWQSFEHGLADPFDPLSHQQIVVLYSTVSSITSAPCNGPELLTIGFYAGMNRLNEEHHDEDIPFGQYIEDLCLSANGTCKECSKKMCDHHRQYVHGYGQLSVSTLRQPAKMRGYTNTILMWSTCRLCRHETTITPMSDHTWKYSFAKYLELSFWSSPLHPRAGLCKHDIHKDFLRCFGYQDMIVRFQYDSIDIYDVIVPRGRVTWRVDADLSMKNEQYCHFEKRLTAFTDSIRKRLDSINVDPLEEKKAQEAYAVLEKLRLKAEEDHKELLTKLQQKYSSSRYFEVIPLNRALRLMDEKAIEWDQEFNDFERDYFPSETDIRRLAALQLRNMFVESQPSAPASIASDVSDVEEGTEMTSFKKPNAQVKENAAGEILSEKAHDVLSSVVEEHKASNDDDLTIKAIKSNETDTSQSRGREGNLSPRKDLEQAVEREEVRHLDLAIPSQSSGEISPTTSPQTVDNGENDETSDIQPKPLSSGLLERIEQIRQNQATSESGHNVMESKIPRLADLKKRDISPGARRTPPPLLRTQSQPGHVPHTDPDSSRPSIASAATETSSNAKGEAPHVEKRLTDRLGVARLTSKVIKVAPSLIPRSIPHKSEDGGHVASSVSALAKHFEQMSREFEKERLKERKQRAMRSRQARANPLASSRPVVEVYQNATDAVGEKTSDKQGPEKETGDDKIARQHMEELVAKLQPEDNAGTDQDAQSIKSARSGGEEEPRVPNVVDDTDAEDTDVERTGTRVRENSDPASCMSSSIASPSAAPDTIPDTDLAPELGIPEHRKNVWFKYLAEFWSKRSASGWAYLEYPLHSNEHVFEDSDIIVREDEPSSVIALSLSCADYQSKANQFRSQPSKAPPAKHGHSHTISQTSTFDGGEEQHEAIEASLLSDTGTHMKYSFAHGQVKASCKIFYAESFDALRRKCGVADRFKESMSRCLKFDSKGGKTKSLFLRTLDNRFIIKSLQEVELKAFTKFAPDYFNFMSYTLFHGVPSVIAKMFGLFQVNIRNPTTGVDFSYYLLVMENLFYERSPNRRFDLKGSMRNRKIESTGEADEVLLDENLVETIFESPLFVREHSRKLLQASVFNDTLWLCKQNVMDYSLMAGFDDQRKELIVGIIDCIRTYTWDKKLESWIKDRGKNKPTITSPKDYRNRFRVSMMQYVLQAPNCWHQFHAQMAPPKTLKENDRHAESGYAPDPETGDDGNVGVEENPSIR